MARAPPSRDSHGQLWHHIRTFRRAGAVTGCRRDPAASAGSQEVAEISADVPSVGIIANPASGKDIRRLVAHASTFDNTEKINIVRRALLALDALGVREVWHMPDTFAIVRRAADAANIRLTPQPLPMAMLDNAGDSFEAAQRMVDLGCGAILTLGGDGTNRVVAKGCGNVPLVAISTGTNNVFPRMVEGTLAGMAAALAAQGAASEAIARRPRLDITINEEFRDMALIDVVTSRQMWIGARSVWDASQLREIVLSRIRPGEIGIASIGGMIFPEAAGSSYGAHIQIGGARNRVLAPFAPGVIGEVPVESAAKMLPGESVRLQSHPGTIALDGEREIEIMSDTDEIVVTLNPHGPYVVDIPAAINQGALAGYFNRP